MSEELSVQAHREGAVVDVYAQPRSSKAEIVGAHDGALRLRITAPPVDGKANAAIVALFASQLGVRRSDVEIISGASGRRKRVLVRGLDPRELRSRLAGILGG